MIVESVADWYASTKILGYLLIFGIVGIPLYLAAAISVFERPRNFRAAGVFLGTLLAFWVFALVCFPILAAILGIFVP